MFPIIPANSIVEEAKNQEGIFGYGSAPTLNYQNISNKISNVGVVSTDGSGVGTARGFLNGCEYGGDKGIFGFGGKPAGGDPQSMTNLVSNSGVVSADVTGVGTARGYIGACSYGEDKGIFGFGSSTATGNVSLTNLVSNVGVVATDTVGVGTSRSGIAACEFGGDKGIFGFGHDGNYVSMSNLVSNVGVVATDTAGVGSVRAYLTACSYGDDKGIFGFGYSPPTGGLGPTAITNLVSNVGVVSADVAGVGTERYEPGATQYGGDKGIFGYGFSDEPGTRHENMSNLVSNVGVVSTDATGVGTGRYSVAGCSFN